MLEKQDLQEIQKIVQDETKKIVRAELEKELKPIKRDISKISRDLTVVINTFDNEILNNRRRIDRIEQHLNLEPLEIGT